MAEKYLEPIGRRGWGRGVLKERNWLWRAKTHKWRLVVCEGETALCQSAGGEPWDGRDQTIMFQVVVSFL
jgi:hypothetical protein